MSKVFRLALRDQIMKIDPVRGIRRLDIGPAPGRAMVKMGLADLVDDEAGDFLMLTDAGRGVRELVIELKTALEACDRMRESVVQGIAAVGAVRRDLGRPSPTPLPAAIQSRGSTCGTLNHDSFAAFVQDLNAAGRNAWSMVPAATRNVIPANGGIGQPPSTPSNGLGDRK